MSSKSQAQPFYMSHGHGTSAFARSISGLFAAGASGSEALDLLANNTDDFLRELWVPCASNIEFIIDNVTYQASYEPLEKGIKLQIWATLGYLPFSVESLQRRRMLLEILRGTYKLRNVHFGHNKDHQIIVTQTLTVQTIQPPSFIFAALVPFLQEARPFIQLIGECL